MLATTILKTIETYRLKTRPFDPSIVEAAANVFIPKIQSAINGNLPVQMVLPAFPFKSPNKVEKVLGVLPDKGEEVALARLQGICDAVKDVYAPGAYIVIVSDGLTYNDLLGVSDADVWNYGENLRSMAREGGFASVQFARMSELCPVKDSLNLKSPENAEDYEVYAPLMRAELLEKWSDADYDVSQYIASDLNTLATYKSYLKFLALDLATSPYSSDCDTASVSSGTSSSSRGSRSVSRKSIKRNNQRVAKSMLARGKCFANLIQGAFPDAVRLSIHASRSMHKISVSVLPETNIPATPWHSAIICKLDGTIQPASRAFIVENEDALTPIYKYGRLWCYREKSILYSNLGVDVEIDHIYPCGLRITAIKENTSFTTLDMQKIRQLAEHNSPVILRGFQGTENREIFKAKSQEMGEIQKWKFGEVLEVKDASESGGLNNVLSAEPMPMHFDGMFKLVDGKPNPPKFQIFTSVTASPPGLGYTLFASSRLFFQMYPRDSSEDEDNSNRVIETIAKLSTLTYSVETAAFDQARLTKLPLVESHPALGKPVLRYHEHWPRSRTVFDPTIVEIENMEKEEGERIRADIEKTLYDRRVCLRVYWEKGDICVSDNVDMMHTRDGFPKGMERELWRIHVN